jgi:hypothetical protein
MSRTLRVIGASATSSSNEYGFGMLFILGPLLTANGKLSASVNNA